MVTQATYMGPRGHGEGFILAVRKERTLQGFEQLVACSGCCVEKGLPGAGVEQENQPEMMVAQPEWQQ